MRNERKIWIGLVAVLLLILVYSVNYQYTRAEESNERIFRVFFDKIYYNIKTSYVEKQEPKDLLIGAIKGMLKTLDDPHTAFLEKKQKESLEIETRGQYGGLGIVIGIRDKKLTVISPMEDTPAKRAGIHAGDKILKIDNEPVREDDLDLDKVVKKLRGKPGTDVTLAVQREGFDELIDFTITRENIKLISVKSAIIDDVGYVQLISFRRNSPEELEKVLKEYIQKKKIKGLIFDLRNNSGGLLDVAIKISDFFIDDGLIVYTKPREDAVHLFNSLNRKFNSSKAKSIVTKDIPLVVLVNKGTASASEIFSGAIKDHKRGILVGTKTFGKGSVQSVINLNNNYAMRYTTAYYYTPNGEKIHKKGLDPDIEVEFPRPSREEIEEVRKINKEKLIIDFIKEHKDPTEKELTEFLKQVRQKKINLNDRIVKRLVKQEQYKNREFPAYDIDFDVQLKMALQILRSQIAGIFKED